MCQFYADRAMAETVTKNAPDCPIAPRARHNIVPNCALSYGAVGMDASSAAVLTYDEAINSTPAST